MHQNVEHTGARGGGGRTSSSQSRQSCIRSDRTTLRCASTNGSGSTSAAAPAHNSMLTIKANVMPKINRVSTRQSPDAALGLASATSATLAKHMSSDFALMNNPASARSS